MRALEAEVFDAVLAAVEGLVPEPVDQHPLGCHRRRASTRTCLRGIVIRLVTGCSWTDAEALLGFEVSDTTLRARRDEWVTAGVFDRLAAEARTAYDRIVGLDLDDVAIDASVHKAPCGGEGTGPSPVDRRKSGWKWSLATDRAGIPLAWTSTGAHRNDNISFPPTLTAVIDLGLAADIGTLHLDRSYSSRANRQLCADLGIDLDCAPKRKPGTRRTPTPRQPLGMRWPIERTNSWLSNYGQLRRNTDRRTEHRHAQLALAATLLITAKLLDWRNRWSPDSTPIR